MRAEDAVYGGEMSAHHYFREFAYCDSGMIPWMLITGLMSSSEKTLAQLVDLRIAAYPCSGEINYRVSDVQSVLECVTRRFCNDQPTIDYTDGISMEFAEWRFNLRSSNTEPLLRLNVETRGDAAALDRHLSDIEKIIREFQAT
jgi:phosphomannomutase/phosphoglucomutase